MGVFSEMSFIFGKPKFDDDETEHNIHDDEVPSKGTSIKGNTSSGDTISYKYKITNDPNNNILNPLNGSYGNENSQNSKNPYIKLLEDFNNNDGVSPAKKLRTSDFIYLRDIGVYPINRLVILKRFGTNSPSYDLNDHDTTGPTKMGSSTSTIVGWVKNDADFFNFSFNEVWKTQSKWLHDQIREIIQQQFGIDVAAIFPIPGWGQSMMFDLMNRMDMSSYDKNHMPMGDANLLREGVLRETESPGLSSNISFKLETVYEIKYVNGVDPSIVFHNIIQNLANMGTSDMTYLLKNSSTVRNIDKLFNNPSVKNLTVLITDFVKKAITAVKTSLTTFRDEYLGGKTDPTKITPAQKKAALTQQNSHDYYYEVGSPDYHPYYGSGTNPNKIPPIGPDGNPRTTPPSNDDISKGRALRKKESDDSKGAKVSNDLMESGKQKYQTESENLNKFDLAEKTIKAITNALDSILAATLSRYKWQIKGAINQSTGANNTPWHLTIGNPYSPIISMNHIKVSNVEVKLGNELLFNDLPKFIHVTVSIEQARNLGKQEIMRMFGVKYKRDYSKASTTNDPLNADIDNTVGEQVTADKAEQEHLKFSNTLKPTINLNQSDIIE